MKCPHCGAQVGLEDKYCPFCGLPNEFAQKHQEDMDRYQQEFQQTQSDVYQKTRRFTELTVPLTVVFVLIILNIGAYIFVSKSWEIGSSLQKQEIHTHLTEHQENIDTYIQNGEFCGLSSYYSQNSLYYEDEFDKYNALIRASDSYRDIYRILVDTSNYYPNYYFDDDEISHTITTLARDIHDIFNLEENYSYNKEEYFTDETNAALVDLRTQTKAVLVAYAGLTAEEADALPDLSTTKQKEYLERGLENQ